MTIKNKNIKGKIPVLEEFYSIQGEGFNTGKASYFIRTGGCDLACSWCDSKESWDHTAHQYIDINEIIKRINKTSVNTVIVTGGEPLIYNFDEFCNKAKAAGLNTMIETCGAHNFSGKWDWICLSPKKHKPPKNVYFNFANELKVIIFDKEDFNWAEKCAKKVSESCLLYLQPEWSRFDVNAKMIVEYVKTNIKWNISIQTHKFLKIP